MRVEPATTADVDTLTEQWVALCDDQREHGTHLLADANRTAARSVLAQRVATDQVLVARDDATIAGFVTYYIEDGLYAEDATRGTIENVYVAPEHRNQGVGTRLLDAAERELEERGADVLNIAAMAQNTAARRLYESRDYTTHRVVMEKSTRNDNHTNEEG